MRSIETTTRRLKKFKRQLDAIGMEGAFVHGPSSDLHYLMGLSRETHTATDDEKFGEWFYGAVIPVEGDVQVIGPRMGAGPTLTAALEGTPWIGGLHVAGDGIMSEYEEPAEVFRRALEAAGSPSSLGLAGTLWARRVFALQSAAPGISFRDASPILARMRAIKDEEEVAALRRAAALTERAFAAVLPQLALGLSEHEIAAEVDRLFLDFGAEGSAFDSGVRISAPGIAARPVRGRRNGAQVVQPGVSLTFDMGCILDGYASDFGRTVFWGEPDAETLARLSLVMESRQAAVEAMKAGSLTASDLSRIARAPIEEAGYGEGLRHWVGHGIGLEVHEAPVLHQGDMTVLEEGMCLALEPSIRIPDCAGVRCEDVIMVTPEGGESLHTFSREPLVLG